MSASREKKMRQQQGQTAPVVEEKNSKKPMNKTVKRTLIVICSIVLIAAIVFLTLVSNGFFAKHSTAAVVNGHKLTPAMVNYFYSTALNNSSEMLSYFVDTTVPLDEQPYINDTYETWADYVLDQAMVTAAEVYAIYDKAVEDGYELSEENKAVIESSISSYDMYASLYGYANADAMITAEFGTGCNTKNYTEYNTITLIASEYANAYNDTLVYTDEEIDAYYEENAEDFDAASFRVYFFGVNEDSEDAEAELAALEETAMTIAEGSKGNELTFIENVLAALPEDQQTTDIANTTLRSDYTKASCEDIYADWVFDPLREAGDTTYIVDEGNGCYVLYYVGPTDNSYLLPNVRHILVSVSDTTDEAAMTDAMISAEAILDEFESGEQTEEAFAALADENSDDGAEGGLYENIAHGQMVESFENWCYDASREVGDVEIIESEYGYHIMYFSGYGDNYLDYSVENTLRTNDFDTWYDAIIVDADYTLKPFGMRFSSAA